MNDSEKVADFFLDKGKATIKMMKKARKGKLPKTNNRLVNKYTVIFAGAISLIVITVIGLFSLMVISLGELIDQYQREKKQEDQKAKEDANPQLKIIKEQAKREKALFEKQMEILEAQKKALVEQANQPLPEVKIELPPLPDLQPPNFANQSSDFELPQPPRT